jgi:lipoyl(octanoyl) transferase
LVSEELWVIRCGQVPYEPARVTQRRLESARQADQVPDLLLLLEHPPVYTRGRRSEPGELPMGEDWYRAQGIEVCDTDRGGRVTYHGPGQLVGYPIVDLKPYGDDVHDYVRRMERVMIDSLDGHGVKAGTIEGLTGVWTVAALRPEQRTVTHAAEPIARGEARKIGSIGVHVSRGITTHGFAINVNNDLQPFEWIVPCGIEGCRTASLARELGAAQDMSAFMDTVCDRFGEVYDRQPLPVEAAELADRVKGIEALVVAGPAATHIAGNGAPAAIR